MRALRTEEKGFWPELHRVGVDFYLAGGSIGSHHVRKSGFSSSKEAAMGGNTLQGQELECPLDGQKTEAETQEGHAARLIEHYLDNHPGGLPKEVVDPIKTITGNFK